MGVDEIDVCPVERLPTAAVLTAAMRKAVVAGTTRRQLRKMTVDLVLDMRRRRRRKPHSARMNRSRVQAVRDAMRGAFGRLDASGRGIGSWMTVEEAERALSMQLTTTFVGRRLGIMRASDEPIEDYRARLIATGKVLDIQPGVVKLAGEMKVVSMQVGFSMGDG